MADSEVTQAIDATNVENGDSRMDFENSREDVEEEMSQEEEGGEEAEDMEVEETALESEDHTAQEEGGAKAQVQEGESGTSVEPKQEDVTEDQADVSRVENNAKDDTSVVQTAIGGGADVGADVGADLESGVLPGGGGAEPESGMQAGAGVSGDGVSTEVSEADSEQTGEAAREVKPENGMQSEEGGAEMEESGRLTEDAHHTVQGTEGSGAKEPKEGVTEDEVDVNTKTPADQEDVAEEGTGAREDRKSVV